MELKVHDQEILLQKLWKSRKLFDQELKSLDGKKVEVIFAGTENLDSGPDFKDAVVKLDGRLFKGDVEVHLDASGWYAHGHHADSRYNNVILHLISEGGSQDNFIEREDCVRVRQLLVDLTDAKVELWKKTREDTPSDVPSVVEDCPLSRCSETKILATASEAGARRLLEKAEQLREDLVTSSWDHLIYKKVLEALGYSKNQIPFGKLAELVPYEIVCSEMQWVAEDLASEKCAALLFGAAGLLPSQSKMPLGIRDRAILDYVAPLEVLWEQISHRLEIKPMKSEAWQFFRLRPQNFPTRRIAGAVQILSKFAADGFLQGFLKAITGSSVNYKRMTKELETVLVVKAEGFWVRHYRFMESDDGLPGKADTALIGKQRARDIVVNIVLPALYLYGSESQDGALKNLIHELFTTYPKLADNLMTRAMKSQLFDQRAQKARGVQLASQHQGLIWLHKMLCRPLKCAECLRLSDCE